jgi:hypothetical protein
MKLKGCSMSLLGLSIEVDIPPLVDIAAVIALGKRSYPYATEGDEDYGEMDIGEAIQWAFTNPGGVAALAAMGITWVLCQTGSALIDMRGTQIA